MQLQLKITPAALVDLQEGITYYDSQQNGLGRKFESSVNTTLKKIKEYPYAASLLNEIVRYKAIKNYPYIILYEVNTAINVLRIVSTHWHIG